MKRAILDAVSEVDMIILVVEAFKEPNEVELSLIESIKKQKSKAILVINKTDCIKDKNRLAELILKYSKLYSFEEIVPASAQNGNNLDVVLDSSYVRPYLENHPMSLFSSVGNSSVYIIQRYRLLLHRDTCTYSHFIF